MDKLRVLFIANNHPDLQVGGAEVFSYELFKAMKASREVEPVFLARTTASGYTHRARTPFRSVNDDPNEILWLVQEYDPLFITSPAKEQYTIHFDNLLKNYRPDVVHIQHTIGLGVDLIRQIKNTLPNTVVVYTLHEMLPICHADGHMVRTRDDSLCHAASPVRCHECFPQITAQQFFLRERFLKAQFDLVDLFLSPSQFLVTRFLEWGISPDRIRFIENGRVIRRAEATDEVPKLSRFGFFGQLSHHKGILVLLEAIKHLRAKGKKNIQLELNGSNLDLQTESFRKKFTSLLEDCGPQVMFRGKYTQAELADRMRSIAWVVIPSIWWENSPMVIQEATMHGRPVIATGIGGMAEKVRHEVDGLHFGCGDVADLAKTLKRAASDRDLWQNLRDNARPIFTMQHAIEAHISIYRSLRGERPALRLEHYANATIPTAPAG